MLTFGLGAGLGTGEFVALRGRDVIRDSTTNLVAVNIPGDRLIPVRLDYAELAWELARSVDPDATILGQRPSKDTFGKAFKAVKTPAWLPEPPIMSRLRSTWMVELLEGGVRLPEFQALAGLVSMKTLTMLSQFVEFRIDGHEYMRVAAGHVSER